jgi:hypothetical protein
MLDFPDIVRLLHPILAITFIFPIIGLTVTRAWQTRQRRLQVNPGKEKLPPTVGREHLDLGKLLAAGVVGLSLVGITRPILANLTTNQVWSKDPFKVAFLGLIYVATIASLVLLYKAATPLWRAVFATLTGMGVAILCFQDGVFRRDNEWYISHFYFGLIVTELMIFSLAIVPEIYRDRTLTWRKVHIALSCLALTLFLAQGITGARDLLEIPLGWQEPFVYKCDVKNKTCPTPP